LDSPDDPADLLALLLRRDEASDGWAFTDQELVGEVSAFLLAGHEVAHGLTWSWYLLARHPESERLLRAELSDVLGGRPPTMADLPRLTYTQMVLQEALRLYPPVWCFTRAALADDEIDGYHIPRAATVYLCPYLTHRHPAFWHDPERFDPERFDPRRSVSQPPFAYFPFGAGPRACIGARFAMAEGQLVLASVAQRYRLRLQSDRPL